MTPLELQLEGFTCYRSRASISWQGTDVGLFAVTGPTGAGKSTLLDAIVYALYGQTPRLGGRGLDSLLSPGATAMNVQLTFRAARGVFRVTRAAQRRSASVATEVRVEQADPAAKGGWRQLPESERVRDANKAIEEIVGLDYSGFTRAVLLPQGAFDEFLRGDAAERRKLLVALLGLDRVDRMRELAGRLGREADANAGALERRLAEDYADVSAESVRSLTEAGEGLRAAGAEAEKAATELEARAALAGERARLEEALAGLERRRAALDAQSARVAAQSAELEAARSARLLAPAIGAHRTATRRAEQAAAELERARSAAADAQAALGPAAATLARANESHAERAPELERRVAALQALAPAFATLRRVGGSVGGRMAAAGGAGEWLDDDAWSALQVAEGQLATVERAEAEVASASGLLERAQAEAAAAGAKVKVLEADLEQREVAGKALKAAAEGLAAAHREAMLQDAAAAVRAHVHVGDDCPVCGERVRSLPAGPAEGALSAAAAAAAAAESELETARAEYNRVRAGVAAAKAGHEAAARKADEAQARAGEAAEQRAAAAERLRTLLGARAPEGEGAAELGAAIVAARATLVAGHAAALRAALVDAGVADPDGFDERRGGQAAQAELEALRGGLEAARRQHEQAERAAQRAADQETAAASKYAADRADAETAAADLAAAIAASGFGGAAAAEAAVRPDARMAELAAEVEAHAADLAALERGAVEARAALMAQPPLPDPLGEGAPAVAARLRSELAALHARRTQLAADLATTLDRLATATARLERRRELSAELTAARAKADLHRQLALDLRGDRFQDYLMTHVQQRLARRASATLRHVTDGRFELRLQDGDYYVSDAWAGFEQRSARTLSGGESFVASLALALALSDTLAGNAALGALFLDEGFGTLDRATLDSVTSVLEALTDEGRMVGVITHVTELSERLPARLVVTKGQDGSTVAWDV